MKQLDYTLVNAGDDGKADNDGLIQRGDTIPSDRVEFKFQKKK